MSTPEVPSGGGPLLPTDAGAPVDDGPSADEVAGGGDEGADEGEQAGGAQGA